MSLPVSPATSFLIVLAIGIGAGLAFNRYAGSWLARLGRTSRTDITSALVGIAGSFIGFNLGVLVGLAPALAYLAAIAGAVLVLWFWRGR